MISHGRNIQLFCANASVDLAKRIAAQLGLPLSQNEVKTFSDGEISVSLFDSVRGRDVFVIQSTNYPVNDNLMELLIMIDALKRASAGRITAIMPYFGYSRQDRKAKARDPISAKLVANLITTAGADRVLTMDLHAPQIQGFFDIPVDNLQGAPLLADYFIQNFGDMSKDTVVVSPDLGSVTRSRAFAQRCNAPLAIIDKRRARANVSEVCNIIGDVKGKRCILIDDMIDTAGTICNAGKALIEVGGATEVYCGATHAVLSGSAIERFKESAFKKVILLDTIAIPEEKMLDKFVIIRTDDIFAKAIKCIYDDQPISLIFN